MSINNGLGEHFMYPDYYLQLLFEGVMSQETHDSLVKFGPSVVVASYVKYLESGGARVVLVKINQSHDYYIKLFNSLNGLLLPGGDQLDVLASGYGKAAKIFFDMSIEGMKKNGDYFPIWGTCEGHQLLASLAAGKDILISGIDAENLALPLELTSDFVESRIFDVLTTSGFVFKAMTTENSTYNAHHFGVTMKNLTTFGIDKFFRVTSVNKDRKGVEFISTMEAFEYPIYGVQWHPEKNIFEWNPHADSAIPHSTAAVSVAQHTANFFVREARKSTHKFSSEDEASKYLVYNNQAVYIADAASFEQGYFLDV
ncbi:gamma-glutamyl hydrolase-like isoform X2 [Antedon mediterranea]|uniref:gamma-glutamyl hydrolase-like isoform X2 n=1 Tax=Antedon mediterranea TaxID=105859 RepID=UPI003AF54818